MNSRRSLFLCHSASSGESGVEDVAVDADDDVEVVLDDRLGSCCGCCCCCWAAAILALKWGGRYFFGAAAEGFDPAAFWSFGRVSLTSDLAGGFGGAAVDAAAGHILPLLKSDVIEWSRKTSTGTSG